MRPAAYEIRCDAYDCDPEQFRPWSRPLRVEAGSARDAAKLAKRQGWTPAYGKGWWCPRHRDVAQRRRAELAGRGAVATVDQVHPEDVRPA